MAIYPFPAGIAFGNSGTTSVRLDIQNAIDRVADRIGQLGGGAVPDNVKDAAEALLRGARPILSLTFNANGACDRLPQSSITSQAWKQTGLEQFTFAVAKVKLVTQLAKISQMVEPCVDTSRIDQWVEDLDLWQRRNADYYRRLEAGAVLEDEAPPEQPEFPAGPIPVGKRLASYFWLKWYAEIDLTVGPVGGVARLWLQTDTLVVKTTCCFE